MIFKARHEHWTVIDATNDILIAHQNHDYNHLAGGQPHYRQPETKENVRLAGGKQTIFTLLDAQKKMINGKLLRSSISWKKFWREVEIYPLIKFKSDFTGKIFYYIFHPYKAYVAFRRLFKS